MSHRTMINNLNNEWFDVVCVREVDPIGNDHTILISMNVYPV